MSDLKQVLQKNLDSEYKMLELLTCGFNSLPAKLRKKAIARHKRRIKLILSLLELL